MSVHQSQKQTQSYALIAGWITLLIWSGTAVANKIAIHYMDGLSAGAIRSLIASIIALVVILCLRFPFPKTKKDQLLLFISGVSSFALWPVLMSVGIEHTSVGHAALIMTLIPVFTVLFGALIQHKLPTIKWWIGACIAVIATIVLILNKHDIGASAASVKGDIIVLIGGIICAMGYVAGGKLSPKLGTAATTFWGLSITIIIFIPLFIYINDNTNWSAVALDGWLAIAWMIFLSSIAGYALWFYALGQGGTGRIGSLLFLMPVLTLLFANLVLDEVVSGFMIIICGCIIFGTYYAQKNAS